MLSFYLFWSISCYVALTCYVCVLLQVSGEKPSYGVGASTQLSFAESIVTNGKISLAYFVHSTTLP